MELPIHPCESASMKLDSMKLDSPCLPARSRSNEDTCDGSSVETGDDTTPSSAIVDIMISDCRGMICDNTTPGLQDANSIGITRNVMLAMRMSCLDAGVNQGTCKAISQAKLQMAGSSGSSKMKIADAAPCASESNAENGKVALAPDQELNICAHADALEDETRSHLQRPPGLSYDEAATLQDEEDEAPAFYDLEESDSEACPTEAAPIDQEGEKKSETNDCPEDGLQKERIEERIRVELSEAKERAKEVATSRLATAMHLDVQHQAALLVETPVNWNYFDPSVSRAAYQWPAFAQGGTYSVGSPLPPYTDHVRNAAAEYLSHAAQMEQFGNWLTGRADESSSKVDSTHLLKTAAEYYASASNFAAMASSLSTQADSEQMMYKAVVDMHQVGYHRPLTPPGSFQSKAHENSMPVQAKRSKKSAAPKAVGIQQCATPQTQASARHHNQPERSNLKKRVGTRVKEISVPDCRPVAKDVPKIPSAADFPPLGKPCAGITGIPLPEAINPPTQQIDAQGAKAATTAWSNRLTPAEEAMIHKVSAPIHKQPLRKCVADPIHKVVGNQLLIECEQEADSVSAILKASKPTVVTGATEPTIARVLPTPLVVKPQACIIPEPSDLKPSAQNEGELQESVSNSLAEIVVKTEVSNELSKQIITITKHTGKPYPANSDDTVAGAEAAAAAECRNPTAPPVNEKINVVVAVGEVKDAATKVSEKGKLANTNANKKAKSIKAVSLKIKPEAMPAVQVVHVQKACPKTAGIEKHTAGDVELPLVVATSEPTVHQNVTKQPKGRMMHKKQSPKGSVQQESSCAMEFGDIKHPCKRVHLVKFGGIKHRVISCFIGAIAVITASITVGDFSLGWPSPQHHDITAGATQSWSTTSYVGAGTGLSVQDVLQSCDIEWASAQADVELLKTSLPTPTGDGLSHAWSRNELTNATRAKESGTQNLL